MVDLDDSPGSISPDAHNSQQEAQARRGRGDDLLLEEGLDLATDLLAVDAPVRRRLLLLLGAPVARRVERGLAVHVGADDVVARLHAAGGGPVLPAGRRWLLLSLGRRGLVGLGVQVRGDEVGDGQAGERDQRGRVQEVGVAGGPGGQGEGEEEGGARDAREGPEVRPRGGGQGAEGIRGCAGGWEGEEGRDCEGGEGVG